VKCTVLTLPVFVDDRLVDLTGLHGGEECLTPGAVRTGHDEI